MAQALANPIVTINNEAIFVLPNSVMYTEGKGEQNIRTQSAGGGAVQTVFSEDVESNKSKVNLSITNTQENIDIARTWKSNQDANVISIVSPGFSRTISSTALINDYEVNLSADGEIALEFEGLPSV